MFVVAQDFSIKPFNLVNLPEDGTFDDYVSDREEEHLRKVLGNYLYDLLVDGVNSLPALWDEDTTYVIDDEVTFESVIWKSLVVDNLNIEPIEGANWTAVIDARTKWAEVVYGSDYVYENAHYKWSGMNSMIKPLIFSLWVEDNAINTNSSGLTIPRVENSEHVSPAQSISRAWNIFIDKACGEKSRDCNNIVNCLFGYIYVNSEEFDTLFVDETCKAYMERYFINIGRKNIFNI